MAADLHCHTKLSDGSVAIDELVILAKNKGIPTIAVTDHDTFAGATRAKIFGQRHGVEVIHGAEISTFDYQRKRLVHLLCYMCEHPARLEGLFGKILANRRKAVSIALQKVMRLYPITPEMVAKRAQGSTAIYKQHIMQTLVDAGYADKMYGPLYDKLFNWKIGIAKTNIEYPDVFEVLEQIHDAGGVAVLAHPAVYDTYALLLFDCSKYHLLVLLFSTSLFGVLLIPATLALRGFALACSAAWIASTYTDNGTALALVVLGLPALFTVPALFVASQWGMMFSSRLLAGFMRRPLPVYRTRGENRLLAVCVMLFAAAAVEYFLVPPIVRLLI